MSGTLVLDNCIDTHDTPGSFEFWPIVVATGGGGMRAYAYAWKLELFN